MPGSRIFDRSLIAKQSPLGFEPTVPWWQASTAVRPATKTELITMDQESSGKKRIFVLLGGLIALIPLVCGSIYLYVSTSPLEFVPDTPVEYTLPASADVIEQKADSADFFGDYAYCALFKLPSSEIGELIEKGFEWIDSDPWNLPPEEKPEWKTGILPDEVLNGFYCLKNRPHRATVYNYLYKWDDLIDNQWRAFVIDEGKRVVYYCRTSW